VICLVLAVWNLVIIPYGAKKTMLQKKFRYFAVVLILALSLLAVSCVSSPASSLSTPNDIPARNWKMSVVTSEDSSWAKGARLFADSVKKRTGGRIQIKVYPDGALAGGDQVKELNMLREGGIDFTYHSNLLYSNLDQSFAVLSLPWLFTSYSQVDAALAGPGGEHLLKLAEAQGIIGLAFGENGFRQLTNNRIAVHRPDDLAGLKIRIPGVKLYNSIFESLKAVPVNMNFSQLVSALRSWEIDGEENPIDVIESSKLYDVQKYITLWNYSYDAIILGINRSDWDGLPQAARDIIREAAVEASKEQIKLSRQAAQTKVGLLRDYGMVITELTPDEISAFQAKVEPVYAEWSPKLGEPLIQQFRLR
jgi:TRAP-type transport system periplasmic protein